MPTAWEREQERERKARYLAEREAETRGRNEVISRRLADLDSILIAGISHSVALDHNARKLPPPVFDAGGLDRAFPEPKLEHFFPHEPGSLARLVPGWKGRHEKQGFRAQAEFGAAHTQHGRFKIDTLVEGGCRAGLTAGGWLGDLRRVAAGWATELR